MPNIYYDPEKFGPEVVAEIEYSDQNYNFDTRVVWKRKEDGELFTARDSGCSCPTPFEDYNLSNIDKFNFDAIRREVNEELSSKYKNITPETAQQFLEKLRA